MEYVSAATGFLSLLAASYVLVMVAILALDTETQEGQSVLRISPSMKGVRIFQTTPKYQAQLWIPWEKMWETARMGFAMWRAFK